MKKSILLAAIVLVSVAALVVAETGRCMITAPAVTDSPLKVVRLLVEIQGWS